MIAYILRHLLPPPSSIACLLLQLPLGTSSRTDHSRGSVGSTLSRRASKQMETAKHQQQNSKSNYQNFSVSFVLP